MLYEAAWRKKCASHESSASGADSVISTEVGAVTAAWGRYWNVLRDYRSKALDLQALARLLQS